VLISAEVPQPIFPEASDVDSNVLPAPTPPEVYAQKPPNAVRRRMEVVKRRKMLRRAVTRVSKSQKILMY
jgi:hypothetical protein